MDSPNLNIPRRKIAEFCRKYNIQKLAFFGSVLREDFKPTSDVDVLVEFKKGGRQGINCHTKEVSDPSLASHERDTCRVIHEYDSIELDIVWDII